MNKEKDPTNFLKSLNEAINNSRKKTSNLNNVVIRVQVNIVYRNFDSLNIEQSISLEPLPITQLIHDIHDKSDEVESLKCSENLFSNFENLDINNYSIYLETKPETKESESKSSTNVNQQNTENTNQNNESEVNETRNKKVSIDSKSIENENEFRRKGNKDEVSNVIQNISLLTHSKENKESGSQEKAYDLPLQINANNPSLRLTELRAMKSYEEEEIDKAIEGTPHIEDDKRRQIKFIFKDFNMHKDDKDFKNYARCKICQCLFHNYSSCSICGMYYCDDCIDDKGCIKTFCINKGSEKSKKVTLPYECVLEQVELICQNYCNIPITMNTYYEHLKTCFHVNCWNCENRCLNHNLKIQQDPNFENESQINRTHQNSQYEVNEDDIELDKDSTAQINKLIVTNLELEEHVKNLEHEIWNLTNFKEKIENENLILKEKDMNNLNKIKQLELDILKLKQEKIINNYNFESEEKNRNKKNLLVEPSMRNNRKELSEIELNKQHYKQINAKQDKIEDLKAQVALNKNMKEETNIQYEKINIREKIIQRSQAENEKISIDDSLVEKKVEEVYFYEKKKDVLNNNYRIFQDSGLIDNSKIEENDSPLEVKKKMILERLIPNDEIPNTFSLNLSNMNKHEIELLINTLPQCGEFLSKVSKLNLSSNYFDIDVLDLLSKCDFFENVQSLDLSNSFIDTDDKFRNLKYMTKLVHLTLENCKIGDAGLTFLNFDDCFLTKNLISLNLTGNNLKTDSVNEIYHFIPKPLKNLKLGKNNLGDNYNSEDKEKRNLVNLIFSLKAQNLKSLDLSYNNIQNEALQCFINFSETFSSMTELYLNNNKIDAFGISKLLSRSTIDHFTTLNFPNLITLDLSGNNIGYQGVEKLLEDVSPILKQLKKLYLADCNITDKGIQGICINDLLNVNNERKAKFLNNLIVIDLSSNFLTNFGFNLLVSSDNKFETLECLILRDNNFEGDILNSVYNIDIEGKFKNLCQIDLLENYKLEEGARIHELR